MAFRAFGPHAGLYRSSRLASEYLRPGTVSINGVLPVSGIDGCAVSLSPSYSSVTLGCTAQVFARRARSVPSQPDPMDGAGLVGWV
jgi:hypothetical protein